MQMTWTDHWHPCQPTKSTSGTNVCWELTRAQHFKDYGALLWTFKEKPRPVWNPTDPWSWWSRWRLLNTWRSRWTPACPSGLHVHKRAPAQESSGNLSTDILTVVYHSLIESTLTNTISTWFTFLTIKHKSKRYRMMNKISKLTQTTQPLPVSTVPSLSD